MKDNWYIYRHLKPCGEVFYIGIGQTKNYKRAYSKHNRNTFWKNVVSKYGYEVQIIKTKLSHHDVCELEILLIDWYGRKDLGTGRLVNLTNGGEGVIGFQQSEESKKKRADKISILYEGEGNPFFGKRHSEEIKKYIGDIQIEYHEYNNPKVESITKSTYRKSSKKVYNIQTYLTFNSLREASECYGIPYTALKGRMRLDKMYRGDLWYKDETLDLNNCVPNIISFLEKTKIINSKLAH